MVKHKQCCRLTKVFVVIMCNNISVLESFELYYKMHYIYQTLHTLQMNYATYLLHGV